MKKSFSTFTTVPKSFSIQASVILGFVSEALETGGIEVSRLVECPITSVQFWQLSFFGILPFNLNFLNTTNKNFHIDISNAVEKKYLGFD